MKQEDFILNVDYSKSFKEIFTFSNLDFKDPFFTKNTLIFPKRRIIDAKLKAKLLFPEKDISTQDLINTIGINMIGERRFRFATFQELMFYKINLEKKRYRDFPVISLGEIFKDKDGTNLVPMITTLRDMRGVLAEEFKQIWPKDYAFLLVEN